jgi:Bacterial transcriptional activator domain
VSAASEAPLECARTLVTAFSLWRGSPLIDARYEDFAQAEILRLEELHAWALELRLETELELGRAEEIVPELSSLVLRFPFREKLRRLLITALHRSGRSVEAIESFVEWRQLLRLTWGLEPGRLVAELLDEIRLEAPALAEAMTDAGQGTVGGRAATRRSRSRRQRGRGTSRSRLERVAGKRLNDAGGSEHPKGRWLAPLASVAQRPSAGFPIRRQRFDSSRRLVPAWARSRRSASAAPGVWWRRRREGRHRGCNSHRVRRDTVAEG